MPGQSMETSEIRLLVRKKKSWQLSQFMHKRAMYLLDVVHSLLPRTLCSDGLPHTAQ